MNLAFRLRSNLLQIINSQLQLLSRNSKKIHFPVVLNMENGFLLFNFATTCSKFISLIKKLLD